MLGRSAANKKHVQRALGNAGRFQPFSKTKIFTLKMLLSSFTSSTSFRRHYESGAGFFFLQFIYFFFLFCLFVVFSSWKFRSSRESRKNVSTLFSISVMLHERPLSRDGNSSRSLWCNVSLLRQSEVNVSMQQMDRTRFMPTKCFAVGRPE